MNAWIYYGGGQKLLDEFYANYNIISFAGGNTGVQMGGWFRKEINTLADIKGLKMRIAGLGGAVYERLGAVTQQIRRPTSTRPWKRAPSTPPSGSAPTTTRSSASTRSPRTTTTPAGGKPGPVIHFFVNKKAWAKLPKVYQEAFTAAAYEANVTMMAEYDHKNPQLAGRAW